MPGRCRRPVPRPYVLACRADRAKGEGSHGKTFRDQPSLSFRRGTRVRFSEGMQPTRERSFQNTLSAGKPLLIEKQQLRGPLLHLDRRDAGRRHLEVEGVVAGELQQLGEEGADAPAVGHGQHGLLVSERAVPVEDAPQKVGEALAARGRQIPPALAPGVEALAVGLVDLVPGSAVPISEGNLSQAGIDDVSSAEPRGQDAGGLHGAAQVAREDAGGRGALPGGGEGLDVAGPEGGEGQVGMADGPPCAPLGFAMAHEVELHGRRADRARRTPSSTSWFVAPRQSPVMPPSRRRKKSPAARVAAAAKISGGRAVPLTPPARARAMPPSGRAYGSLQSRGRWDQRLRTWAAIRAAAVRGAGRRVMAPSLPRSRRTRARPPVEPMRLSFMASSMRFGSRPDRLAARPSKTSVQPSSCRPPVTHAAAARASTAGTGSGQRRAASWWTPAASPPTINPTMGNQTAERASQSS